MTFASTSYETSPSATQAGFDRGHARSVGLDIPVPQRLRPAIESVMGTVFGVAERDLFRPSRGKASIAHARQVAMYLAHVACGLTLTEVGELFGRDRTTVAHACGVVEDRRDDAAFDRALDLLAWAVPTIATAGTRFPETR